MIWTRWRPERSTHSEVDHRAGAKNKSGHPENRIHL
jgi:hypothetical protein